MNVVVTGGGTIAPIDDVRNLANVSSGRFSAMIACIDNRRRAEFPRTLKGELPQRMPWLPTAPP